ncbi:MAG: redoxin domain-containing protein [Anaerolineales bacterium]|nr:MAG: redoxin domain-containing protein [Anaerolineales bacterium]
MDSFGSYINTPGSGACDRLVPGMGSELCGVRQQAPDFGLPNHLDREVRLSDYRGCNVVLALFPLA